MKHILHYLGMACLALALAGMTACGEKDNPTPAQEPTQEPEPTPEPEQDIENVGTHYAILYNRQAVEPGDTVRYAATEQDLANDFLAIQFILDNKTDFPQSTSQRVTLVEGPESMAHVEICGGGSCPWNGQPYTLQAGPNADLPLAIDITPSEHPEGAEGLYQLIVGQGAALANATIIYLQVTL